MKKIVVLTGAGISAESGLQTFRDQKGLWMGHRVEDVATPGAFKKNPKMVLDFYNERRRNVLEAKPNAAHLGLVDLEKDYNVCIITQNVDDLHERAGSTNILHLHGEILKMRSSRNPDLVYPITTDITLGDVAEDGAPLRPHIVWFEEEVPLIETAISLTREADIFVVIGTSLAVYPAAGLINYVNDDVPIYLLDKQALPIRRSKVFYIESEATKGIQVLLDAIRANS
jgi:NAD-dependent deacetylase